VTTVEGVQVIVDNGEPATGRLSIDVETDNATKPDPQWSTVDAVGHFHAWARGGTYPTLVTVTRHVPCDGTCGGVCGGEGYDEIDYHCRICNEKIDPGRVDDSGVHHFTVSRTWTVEVEGLVGQATQGRIKIGPNQERVTVRIVEGGRTWFGVAEVGEVEARFGPDGMSGATTALHGIGELGEGATPATASGKNARHPENGDGNESRKE